MDRNNPQASVLAGTGHQVRELRPETASIGFLRLESDGVLDDKDAPFWLMYGRLRRTSFRKQFVIRYSAMKVSSGNRTSINRTFKSIKAKGRLPWLTTPRAGRGGNRSSALFAVRWVSSSRSPHQGHDPNPGGSGQAVPDGGQLSHLGRDRLGLHEAAQSLGLGAMAPARSLPETALLCPHLPPTLWPSGEPAVNDCPDTAVVFLGERAPVIDHVLEVGGKCAGLCAARIRDRRISRGKRG